MEKDVEKKKLKEIISKLEKIKGRHTELVTVYIPAGFNLVKVVDQIRTEQSTAMNIKSKTVRKNVMSALETILQHLKLYKQTPPNGYRYPNNPRILASVAVLTRQMLARRLF